MAARKTKPTKCPVCGKFMISLEYTSHYVCDGVGHALIIDRDLYHKKFM